MMRLPLILLLAIWSLGWASAPVAAEGDEAVLLARLESDDFLGIPPEAVGKVYIGGVDRLRFRVRKVLIGMFGQRRLEFTTRLAGTYEPNLLFFIVVKKTPQGPKVVWFEREGGLCWDKEYARKLGLDFDAVPALEKKYPCS